METTVIAVLVLACAVLVMVLAVALGKLYLVRERLVGANVLRAKALDELVKVRVEMNQILKARGASGLREGGP